MIHRLDPTLRCYVQNHAPGFRNDSSEHCRTHDSVVPRRGPGCGVSFGGHTRGSPGCSAGCSAGLRRPRRPVRCRTKPERAIGVAPGHVRLYIEAETQALIAGNVPLGGSLRYLVDVPLTPKGKVPKLKKSEVILFARAVPGSAGAIQLVMPDSQLQWSAELEARLRPILSALAAPTVPPKVTGIRDALSVAGNLTGESETQFFLRTSSGAPLALSVVRRPGLSPAWGVSYSEIVDQAVRAPQPETLGWYRLACFLPQQLPPAANLSTSQPDRARADADYRFVLQQLGPCGRTRQPPPGI
jgi:hypothetical protein